MSSIDIPIDLFAHATINVIVTFADGKGSPIQTTETELGRAHVVRHALQKTAE